MSKHPLGWKLVTINEEKNISNLHQTQLQQHTLRVWLLRKCISVVLEVAHACESLVGER